MDQEPTPFATSLLVLFVPSHDRTGATIDQDYWVRESLETFGRLFGGATAFPKGVGVWRDDDQGGKLHFDAPVVIQCYTTAERITAHIAELRAYFHRMGTEAKQGAIGYVLDGKYYEIRFPL